MICKATFDSLLLEAQFSFFNFQSYIGFFTPRCPILIFQNHTDLIEIAKEEVYSVHQRGYPLQFNKIVMYRPCQRIFLS